MSGFDNPVHRARPRKAQRGSALLEFAVALPLLVVFIVGIFDFSGAFNTKLKIQHAAQLGAVVAAAQPTSDLDPANPNPDSLQPVVTVVFNSLAADGVLPLANQGTCKMPTAALAATQWAYAIAGCPDTINIVINRSWVPAIAAAPKSVGTQLTVTYPYRWRFNTAIQLLVPGASFNATTHLSETATVHNQL